MKEIRLKARAKINLTLDVTGKREDGYHLLETILQTVEYKHWYMGHYHDTTDINKHTILYETIDRIK